jgi:hypothetical protein
VESEHGFQQTLHDLAVDQQTVRVDAVASARVGKKKQS